MKFVGRLKELELLESSYKTIQSTFIPIYGRRRVGKSELILHFLKNKLGLYFVGKKAPAHLQIKEFLKEAAIAFNEPILNHLEVTTWKAAFEQIFTKIPKTKKFILALDEFQWMAETSPDLPSVLQELWDRHWRDSKNIMLILCGSFIGFMEREVLGQKAPLFGRRTAQILLRPFGYQEAALFHPSYALNDKARCYFICGGIPLYLQNFDPHLSIEQNIRNNFLSEFSIFFKEPDFLLREELREVDNYYALLMAIAAGHRENSSIAKFTGISERSLFYYIQQLIDLGYLKKRYALNGSKTPSSKKISYTLEDPLLLFWFRFIYPNITSILHVGKEQTFNQYIKPYLDSYFGSCFERLCREALVQFYLKSKVTAAFEVGEYWDKTVQIDVVGIREDGFIDLGECKWQDKTQKSVITELQQKMSLYPNPREFTIAAHLFSKKKPNKKSIPLNIFWHDLKDIYATES